MPGSVAMHQGLQQVRAAMETQTPLFKLLLELEFRQSSEYSSVINWPPEPKLPNGRALTLWRMNESEKAVARKASLVDHLLKRNPGAVTTPTPTGVTPLHMAARAGGELAAQAAHIGRHVGAAGGQAGERAL